MRRAYEKRANGDRAWYTYPPNILTAFRFALIPPVVILFMMERRIISLALYLLASLTDLIDGKLARKYGMISNWGKAMDPLADKLLLLSVIVCMYIVGDLPLAIILIVLGKELVMILGGIILYGKDRLVIPSNVVGKIGTVLFSIAVVLAFLKRYTAPFHTWCMWLAAAFSVFSLLQYAVPLLKGTKGK